MKNFLSKIKPTIARTALPLLLVGIVIMTGSFFASRGKLGVVNSGGQWRYPFSKNYLLQGEEDFSNFDFSHLHIDVAKSGVNLIPSTDFKVEYAYLQGNPAPVITTQGNVLSVKTTGSDQQNALNMYGFFLLMTVPEPEINVYFPSDKEFDTVILRTRSGDASVEGVHAKETTIFNRYNSMELINVSADQFKVDHQSGSLDIRGLKAQEVTVDTKYGSFDLSGATISKSGVFSVVSGATSLKDVTGNNFTVNYKYNSFSAYNAEMTNLNIRGTSGSLDYEGKIYGTSQLRNQHGSISLDLAQPQEETSLSISSKYGFISVDGEDFSGSYTVDKKSKNSLDISGDSSIEVEFS